MNPTELLSTHKSRARKQLSRLNQRVSRSHRRHAALNSDLETNK
jgi:hypothetical protein